MINEEEFPLAVGNGNWEGMTDDRHIDTDQEILNIHKEILDVRAVAHVSDARAEERWLSYLRALGLQTSEYERRLEHLNGEARRIAEERLQITSQLRREMELGFSSLQRDIGAVREALATFVAEQKGTNKGIHVMWALLVSVLTIGVAITALWVEH